MAERSKGLLDYFRNPTNPIQSSKQEPVAPPQPPETPGEATPPPPVDPIAALRETYQAQVEALQQTLQALQAEREQVEQKLTEFQTRLGFLDQEYDTSQGDLETLVTAYPQQELKLIQAQLQESCSTLEQAAPYWARLIDIYSQRQALLERDPELESVLKEYRDMEKDFNQKIAIFSPSYQAVLKSKHAESGQRVEPYIKLETEEQALNYTSPVILHLFVVHQPAQGQIAWIVPLPADLNRLPPEVVEPLERIALIILNNLITLTRDMNWVFVHVATGDWAGYMMILGEAEYQGQVGLTELTQKLLQGGLTLDPLLDRVPLEITVRDISVVTWELGYQETYPLAESEPETSEAETAAVEIPQQSLSELTSGWYNDEDLKSWTRRVETAPGSLWNEQARRLRTVLLRLIAKGKFEGEGIPFETLWLNLPEPHESALRTGLELLRQRNLLQEIQLGEGQRGVSLNPQMIPEIQNLINRDVTDFWAEIINPETTLPTAQDG